MSYDSVVDFSNKVKQDPVVIGSIDYSECVEICALLKYKDSFFLSRISDLF